MPSTREQDIMLWKEWKKIPSPDNSSKLVNQLLPLVKNDIYRFSSNIPYSVVEGQTKLLILEACRNYDPKSGTALSTFVKSYMIKLNQYNDLWRSPIRIPHNRTYKFNTFKSKIDEMHDSLGREPTIEELSDSLKWSQAEVSRFLKEIRHEFTEDRPFVSNYMAKNSQEKELLDFIYHDLSQKEKLMFERVTGYGGKKIMNNEELCKLFKINQNQLSYEKRKLIEKIDGMLV